MKYLRLFAIGACVKIGLTGVAGFGYYAFQRQQILEEPAVREYVSTQDALKNLEERLSATTFPHDEALYIEYDTTTKQFAAIDPAVVSRKEHADVYARNAMYAFMLAAIGISSAAAIKQKKNS